MNSIFREQATWRLRADDLLTKITGGQSQVVASGFWEAPTGGGIVTFAANVLVTSEVIGADFLRLGGAANVTTSSSVMGMVFLRLGYAGDIVAQSAVNGFVFIRRYASLVVEAVSEMVGNLTVSSAATLRRIPPYLRKLRVRRWR